MERPSKAGLCLDHLSSPCLFLWLSVFQEKGHRLMKESRHTPTQRGQPRQATALAFPMFSNVQSYFLSFHLLKAMVDLAHAGQTPVLESQHQPWVLFFKTRIKQVPFFSHIPLYLCWWFCFQHGWANHIYLFTCLKTNGSSVSLKSVALDLISSVI